MTTKELAEMLCPGFSIKICQEEEARNAGLEVVYSYSEGYVEFRGVINKEVIILGNSTVYLTKNGILEAPACSCAEDCECPYFTKEREKAKSIHAVWHDKGGPYWTFETDIPHETFSVMRNREVFCVGLVFSMKDLEVMA